MDKITQDRIDLLHPKIREEVRLLVAEAEKVISPKLTLRIVQGLRTIEEQNDLYKLGRTTKNPDGATKKKPLGNIVTNAKGGSSYHNYGLAIDFAFLLENKTISWDTAKDWDGDRIADWLEVVKIFVKHGYTWGGNWTSMKDLPHLEKTFGLNWREMRTRYDKKDFITGTRYIRI